ncbi:MAG: transporter substrate-binding domain-containing protein [Lachnospiraceae bacterium]|nr:transporter substrate-binding domain-containing protein [Lachnospiraceae bacterium]
MIKRAVCPLLVVLFLSITVIGCRSHEEARLTDNSPPFSTFRDVPDITAAEIAAVEALQKKYDYFGYAMMPYNEAFIDRHGEIRGFSALACEWLSELFEIPFVPYHATWQEITDGLNSGELDFSGTLLLTEERRQMYYMTDAIAWRTAKHLRLPGSEPLTEIEKTRPLRHAFLTGGVLFDTRDYYLTGNYEYMIVDEYIDAYELLLMGEADSVIGLCATEAIYDAIGGVVATDIFPLFFVPVSLSTGSEELEPIISIFQKALQNGADNYMIHLFNQGYQEYTQNKFHLTLSDEELLYIKENPIISLAADYDNYPINFYNARDREWQGIAFDVLTQIEALTGMSFEITNDQYAEFPDLMQKLEDGDVLLLTELVRTEQRENRFLWPETPFFIDRAALISKVEFPHIKSLNEVYTVKIGLSKNTVSTELFHTWFPNHPQTIEFDGQSEAFNALMRDEVDMVMNSYSSLLNLIHYQGFPGYQANIVFEYPFLSTFGLNVEQEVLRSIIDKALLTIDTNAISEQWKRVSYDHRQILEEAQRPWIIRISIALVLVFAIMTTMLVRDRKKRKIITEQALTLNAAKARTEAIIQNLPGMAYQCLFDPPEYTYVFVSEGSKELLGYTPEELLGDGSVKFFDLIHTDDIEHHENLVSLLSDGQTFEASFRIKDRNGKEKMIWERSHVIETKADGTPHLIEGYYTDITERMMLESAERTQLMLDSSPLSCQLWDEHLDIIDCNEAAVRLFDFDSKQEYIENLSVCSPEYQPDGLRSDETMAGYIKEAFAKGWLSFDWTHQMPDGTMFPADITLVRSEYEGRSVVIGYTRDLRELSAALENKRRADEERERQLDFTQTINDAAALLLTADVAENTNSVLEDSMEQLGVRFDVDRLHLWQNYYGEDGRLYLRSLHRWVRKGITYLKIAPVLCYQDSLPGWVEIFANRNSINGPIKNLGEEAQATLTKFNIGSILCVPIFINNELWGFTSISDVNDQREFSLSEEQVLRSWGLIVAGALLRSETALELKEALTTAEYANQAKSNFLANMSHEIRTPMNSIMGFAELAQSNTTNPQTKEYLKKIVDSTGWLLRIINDILDISKIESGKLEMDDEPFNLHDIFARCQSVLLPMVNEKGLDLRIYAEPLPNRKLVGDQVKLYQALMNLLSNAVKFTDSGSVKFSSTIRNIGEENVTVYFEIKDDGIGMTPEQIEKIFDPFIQADSSTTRDYGGTGLGLTITKNIVELMGGTLAVESVTNVGSMFSFELVFDTIASINGLSPDSEFITIGKPHFDHLALICDDNLMNREVICEHLSQVGIQTVIAVNGKEGVDMVMERLDKGEPPYDLIFMDMFMPVMDGMEAAAKINALDTGTPIIAMTANVMTSELERYKINGIPDCLGKPFTSQELWRVLLKYLKPVESSEVDDKEDSRELQKRLLSYFEKNSQTIHGDIAKAYNSGDMKFAHRLAHTLKGNAGLIGMSDLKNAAAEVEELLKDEGNAIWESKMSHLQKVLEQSLNELRIILINLGDDTDDEQGHTTQDSSKSVGSDGMGQSGDVSDEEAAALLDKLEVMLENFNPDCVNLIDGLKVIAGTKELIERIEDYDFEGAIGVLRGLREG